MHTVAVIGTGSVGAALGGFLRRRGAIVRYGSRDPAKSAKLTVDASTVHLPAEAAVGADFVVLAVPGDAVVETARSLGDLTRSIVIDPTNPVRWSSGGPVADTPPAGSNTAALAEALPGVSVVKAWNVFGAELHGTATLGGEPVDLPLCGTDEDARAKVAELAESLGYRPIDFGGLENARHLESMAVLWIHRAVATKSRRFAWSLRGA